VVAGGQAVIGVKGKNAVGITLLSKGTVCFTGFLVYALVKGIPDLTFVLALSIGSILICPLGAYTTKKIPEWKFIKVLGAVAFILGILTLAKVVNP
jgi:uncharacterized membrane protein YfcA